MVARGDMGVELPAARVPRIQQEIINLCWKMNKPVITATQMLDSMTYNSRPTRAEVTDVSVAIKEGTDAVMLSQETATGTDPVNVVRTMAAIICEEERHSAMSVEQYRDMLDDSSTNEIVTAAAGLTSTSATMLFDPKGEIYPTLSKWNRRVLSILVTHSTHVARHASLFKNIVPLIIREGLDQESMLVKALKMGREAGYLHKGDTLAVVYGGDIAGCKVEQVGALRLVVVD
jgi:pyruvate kinase